MLVPRYHFQFSFLFFFFSQDLFQACAVPCPKFVSPTIAHQDGKVNNGEVSYVIDTIVVLPNRFSSTFESFHGQGFAAAVAYLLGVQPEVVKILSVRSPSTKIRFAVNAGGDQDRANELVTLLRNGVKTGLFRKAIQDHTKLTVTALKLVIANVVEDLKLTDTDGSMPPDVQAAPTKPLSAVTNVRYVRTGAGSDLSGVVLWNRAATNDVTHYHVYASVDGNSRDRYALTERATSDGNEL